MSYEQFKMSVYTYLHILPMDLHGTLLYCPKIYTKSFQFFTNQPKWSQKLALFIYILPKKCDRNIGWLHDT